MGKELFGSNGIRRLTGLGILCALIVVLQVLSNFLSFGPITFNLAMVPMIVGAAIYGTGAAAILGFVFSSIVLISGLTGLDKGFVLSMMAFHPTESIFETILIIYLKGITAPVCSALIYRAISNINETVATIAAGIVCPIVNTGIFILGMLLWFLPFLRGFENYSGASVLTIVLSFVGINFLVELLLNVVLSSAVTRIIHHIKK